MYRNQRVILIAPAYNEAGAIASVPIGARGGPADTVLVVDDCSTDGTARVAADAGATVISHRRRRGVGAAIRTGIDHALANGFDIICIIAGNGKDNPRELPRLLEPVASGRFDYAQGSRYLRGGSFAHMPFYRLVATRLYPWVVSLWFGRPFTDCTNGFRAMRAKVFSDARIDCHQAWLDGYELEMYIHFKVIALGYRVAEVPVSKIYREKGSYTHTKMSPVGWWRMVRPFFFLATGVRR